MGNVREEKSPDITKSQEKEVSQFQPEESGLLRYRTGILILASLLTITFAISSLIGEVGHIRGQDRPGDGIMVVSPTGKISLLPEDTTAVNALRLWGIDTTGMDPISLMTPLFDGSHVKITTDGTRRDVVVSPLSHRELFVLGIPFDINTASLVDLVLIPGVGEKTAFLIIDYRDEHGPFSGIDDLMEIKGIGEKKAVNIAKYVRFCDKIPHR